MPIPSLSTNDGPVGRGHEMQLPQGLHHRRFTEWNHLVRGIMEVWELANALGLEKALEQSLLADRDGALAEQLGKMANDLSTLRRASAASPEPR